MLPTLTLANMLKAQIETPPHPSVAGTPLGFKAAYEADVADLGHPGDGPNYVVRLIDGVLKIGTYKDWEKKRAAEFDAHHAGKKPKFVLKFTDSSLEWYPGEGLAVKDGRLVYADVGEFGGGICWIAKDESNAKVISYYNTNFLAANRKGVFALQSEDHLMFGYAKLVQVVSGPHGWTTKTLTDLHVMPRCCIADGDQFIYGADEFVSTLETSGRQVEIYRAMFDMAPRSLVKEKSGTIWVGASYGVLRLKPRQDGTFESQWFVEK